MPSKFEYFINIPLGQIKSEPGSDDANKNELIAFLKKEGLIKQYAAKDGAVQAEGIPETFEEMFRIDLPNGIFKADTQEQHDALMSNLQSLKDAEILQQLAQKVIKPAQGSAALAPQTIVHVVGATHQAIGVQDVLGRDKELEKMEEVKNLYHRGLPLTLSQAGEAYIKYSFDAKPVNNITAKNYRSRMNKIIEVCGDRYLHELDDDDVIEMELMLLVTPTSKLNKSSTSEKRANVVPKQDSLKRRTVSERLRHLKAVYKKMKIKRRYSGENPLEHWEALVSSRERKKDGQKSIRSVERVEVLFNGEYYSQFRHKAPNMYLLLMTAIVWHSPKSLDTFHSAV